MIPDSTAPVSSVPAPSTQTWVGILTAIAGAAAVIAKKRFSRPRPSHLSPDTWHSLSAKLDSNQKELMAAIGAQSSVIEKRLDALESAVARLDERTRLQSSSSSSS